MDSEMLRDAYLPVTGAQIKDLGIPVFSPAAN